MKNTKALEIHIMLFVVTAFFLLATVSCTFNDASKDDGNTEFVFGDDEWAQDEFLPETDDAADDLKDMAFLGYTAEYDGTGKTDETEIKITGVAQVSDGKVKIDVLTEPGALVSFEQDDIYSTATADSEGGASFTISDITGGCVVTSHSDDKNVSGSYTVKKISE